jgi:hypothetical protein
MHHNGGKKPKILKIFKVYFIDIEKVQPLWMEKGFTVELVLSNT